MHLTFNYIQLLSLYMIFFQQIINNNLFEVFWENVILNTY